MGLIDLKSSLVWTGPPPIVDTTTTAFSAGGNKIPAPYVRIRSNRGNVTDIIQANDSVSLNDSHFNQGISSRLNQGGTGYPFPDSITTKYDWEPIPHTGFNTKNTYSDIIKVTGFNSGKPYGFLFRSYTDHSPIDDVYSKFNLQDEAYNTSYMRQPYILRGIQRKDVQEPQRWGLDVGASVIDIPNGGIVTHANRSAADLIRIGKFLASPKGIIFSAVQAGLQLMNPNVENRLGNPVLPFENYSNSSKTFLPANLLGTIGGSALALRLPRHGIGSDVYRYGDTVSSRIGDEHVNNNRLIKLYRELSETKLIRPKSYSNKMRELLRSGDPEQIFLEELDTIISNIPAGGTILTLSGISGPNSALGVGTTTITRRLDTFQPGRVWLDSKKVTTIDIENNNTDFDSIFTNESAESVSSVNQRYATIAYGKIPNRKVTMNNYGNDVNKSKLSTKYKDILDRNYINDNIHAKYGVINYSDLVPEEKYDTDFIAFQFNKHGGSLNDVIKFRAYLTSLSDDHSGDFDVQQYQGNAYGKYKMTGFSRRINISFMAAAQTQNELMLIYSKMGKLANLASPEYIGNGFVSTFVDVTVGNLFRNQPCVLENVSYSWDITETPWELENGKQLPKYVNVDMQLSYIGNTTPNSTYAVYDLNVTQ